MGITLLPIEIGTRVIAYAICTKASDRYPFVGTVENNLGNSYKIRFDKPVWGNQEVGYFDPDRVRPLNALERMAEET